MQSSQMPFSGNAADAMAAYRADQRDQRHGRFVSARCQRGAQKAAGTTVQQWPWNIGRELQPMEGREELTGRDAARFAGWVRVLSQDAPWLVQRLFSHNGNNSDRGLHTGEVFGRWPSPGALVSYVRKVRAVATRLLGHAAPWWAIRQVLRSKTVMAPRRAGFVVAGLAVTGVDDVYTVRSFRQGRAALVTAFGGGLSVANANSGRYAARQLALRALRRALGMPKLPDAVIGDSLALVASGQLPVPTELAQFRKDWGRLRPEAEEERCHAFFGLLAVYNIPQLRKRLLDVVAAGHISLHDVGMMCWDAANAIGTAEDLQLALEWWLGLPAEAKRRAMGVVPHVPSLRSEGWDERAAGAVDDAYLRLDRRANNCSDAAVAAALRAGYPEYYAKCFGREWDTRQQHELETVPAPAPELGVRRLLKDSPLSALAGAMVGCCQHPMSAAASSAWHAATDADGAIWATFSKDGQMLAQAWVWRNGDALVLDNIEISRGVNKRREALIETFLAAARDVVSHNRLGVTEVWLGAGYMNGNDTTGLGPSVSVPVHAPPGVYTDAHFGWRIA